MVHIKKLVTNMEAVKYFLLVEEIYEIIDAAYISIRLGDSSRLFKVCIFVLIFSQNYC